MKSGQNLQIERTLSVLMALVVIYALASMAAARAFAPLASAPYATPATER